jgi:hypothetical protein
MAKDEYRWSFFRAGGVDQVVLGNGQDLLHLDQLDHKLWLALSCPTRGLEFDSRTLDLVDTDHDGHIRPAEILAAASWARDAFRNLDDLFRGEAKVPLAAIKEGTILGKELLAEARHILQTLGRETADAITLDDIADTSKILAARRFNGDGVLPAESAGDENAARAVRDIMAALGSELDHSGKPGVDQARVDKFFDQAAALLAWIDEGEKAGATRIVGDATEVAAAALSAVRSKIDDYFVRCRLAAFDGRAVSALNAAEADYVALGSKMLAADGEDIAKLPLAAIAPARPLPLADGINPAWSSAIAQFAAAVAQPTLGETKSTLSEADWKAIQDRFAPYWAWQAGKPTTDLANLPPARLRELVVGNLRATLTELIANDAAQSDESQKIGQVEKMILFHRDLVRLLRNFVNFSEFYGKRQAIFQTGTLFIDGRSCDLCLPVDNAGKHASVAGFAHAYLLYCDCTRTSGEKRSIVAAVTGGQTDNLMVGRNGVFCDRKGSDWNATVTRIIENPISIKQAFWTPYKSLIRMVEGQVARRAAAADQEAQRKVEAAAVQTAHSDKTKPDEKKPEPKKVDVGTVAAIGVAVAGVATFLSSVLAIFFGLGVWMPIGLLALLLAISGPSMLIAWLKLRLRNVGPILDANGWSVNVLAKINIPFGAALTQVAALPRGARRELHDPFTPKRRSRRAYLFLLLLLGLAVLWYAGYLDPHLPDHLQPSQLLGH